MADAAYGFRVRNSSYRRLVDITAGETISELTASRDLRTLVNAKLFKPIGEKRGRYYVAESVLREQQERIRSSRVPRETDDPFQLALGQLELTVDLSNPSAQ